MFNELGCENTTLAGIYMV